MITADRVTRGIFEINNVIIVQTPGIVQSFCVDMMLIADAENISATAEYIEDRRDIGACMCTAYFGSPFCAAPFVTLG